MREDDYPYVIPAGAWKIVERVLPYDLARIVMNCAWSDWIVTRVLMPKTTSLVRSHLPKKITEIVMDMFQRVDNDQSCLEWNGEYEAAMCLPSDKLNNAFVFVCAFGYREMYDMMITRGATDWCRGIDFGCYGGHVEIVKDLISRELSTRDFDDVRFWKKVFRRACMSGNIEMIELIEPYTRNGQFLVEMYNNGLETVCYYGYPQMIDYLIFLGASDLNRCLSISCQIKRSESVKHLISRGATYCSNCETSADQHP